MFTKITLAAAIALLLPLAGHAQETFTIKIKRNSKGLATHHERTWTVVADGKRTYDNWNSWTPVKANIILTEAFDQTVLPNPDPRQKATALKRTYQKAAAKVDDDAKVLPYQGKTVIIEKTEGKFNYQYEDGGNIAGEDAEWLDKEFIEAKRDGDLGLESKPWLWPATAVAVGHSWKVDMAELIREFAAQEAKIEADAAKAIGTGKLLKAYKKGGRQYGDFQFKLEIPVKSVSNGGITLSMQPGAKIVMEITDSSCIDGSETHTRFKVGLTFDGTAVDAGNPQCKALLSLRKSCEEVVEEMAQKK